MFNKGSNGPKYYWESANDLSSDELRIHWHEGWNSNNNDNTEKKYVNYLGNTEL